MEVKKKQHFYDKFMVLDEMCDGKSRMYTLNAYV